MEILDLLNEESISGQEVLLRMFVKVNQSLKYDSSCFCPETYIDTDTNNDHFTALRMRGKYILF